MRADILHQYRHRIEQNVLNRVAFEVEDKVTQFFCTSRADFQDKLVVTDDPQYESRWGRLNLEEDEFIDVICVQGPVTRGGGACSYGSREMRDQMMWAADKEQCLGHIVLLDTPGGCAWSKNDFQQAIDYVHSKGQKVIAFIDGMCCSAGMCLACMCDEIIFMHPADEVGCIGTMAAFYATPDGATNTIDGERYIEVYADQSPDKNIEFREAAKGEYEKLIAEITADAEEFHAIVRKGRPNVTDEYLSGKVYRAGDVVGILTDRQGTFDDAVKAILTDYDIYGGTKVYPHQNQNNPKPNQNEMGKNYDKIQSALELEALCSDAQNALFLNEEYCDKIEAALEAGEQTRAALDAKVEENKTLNDTIATLKAEHAQALEDLNAAHAKAIEDLNAAHIQEFDSLNDAHAQALANAQADAQKTIDEKQTAIDTLTQEKTALEQAVADKDAEIQKLSEAAPDPATPAPAEPEGSGSGDGEDGKCGDKDNAKGVKAVLSDDMTPTEKRKALAERMAFLRRQ